MKRRDFLKFFGIGLAASVTARAANARVCLRNPSPFASQPEFATLQSNHAALLARVAALEALNVRTVGTATAGTGVNILAQTLVRRGPVVTGSFRIRHTSFRPIGSTILTLPVGFRPPEAIIGIGLFLEQNSSTERIIGTMELGANGLMTFMGAADANHSRANGNHIINFTFIQ